MEHILKVLNRIEVLEGSLAELYGKLSRTFAEHAEVSDFFSALSGDETSHRDLARYQIRLIRNSRLPVSDVEVNMDCIEGSIRKVSDFSRIPSPTVEDALRVALELESSLAEHYFSSAVKQANADVAGLIDSLCLACRKHQQECREMAGKFNVPPPDLHGGCTAG